MSDDLVKRICKTWIEDGRSDDCFWEGWPEDPTPDDSLTPGMVLARIEELEAKLAKAVELALEECPFRWGTPNYDNWWRHRRTTLAALKGETNE
jgi:hypothetical protein